MVLNFLEIILFLWLVILSIVIYNLASHYKKLTKNVSGTNLQTIFEQVLRKQEVLTSENEENKKKITSLEKDARFHFQKFSIVRFNPFKDTGGNQSFAFALLDADGSGMILSNLYARTGSRWYIKTIKTGKSTEIELSKEEEEAIKSALKS